MTLHTNAMELGIPVYPWSGFIVVYLPHLQVGRSLGHEVVGREPKSVNTDTFLLGPSGLRSIVSVLGTPVEDIEPSLHLDPMGRSQVSSA
jgi:hypothetical protein